MPTSSDERRNIGRYRIDGRIGQGAMGEVFRAWDGDLERPVAIKVLLVRDADDPRALQRFWNQAQALAKVNHANVVRVYERGRTEDGLPFLVTEYLEGRTLSEFIVERGVLSQAVAVPIAVQLCLALDAAHRAGVLHRDIKPTNVMVLSDTHTDQAPVVKLIDFGLAVRPEWAGLTRAGELLGTLPYLAPEILTQQETHSVASEIYALGCLLYEALAGRPPFRASSRTEMALAIRSDTPSDLPIQDDLLASIVMDCLSKNPAERPESAAALLELLQAVALPELPGPAMVGRPLPKTLADGRFTPLRRLGSGHSGTVFAAVDTRDKREVAVKRLHHTGPDQLYRLKREFRILRDVRHTNLVRFEELVFTTRDACLSMEWVHGHPLLDHLMSDPTLLLPSMRQLLQGLQALHDRQLVHRDVKPANVLLDSDGRVVIVDFGLTVHTTHESELGGTLGYLAPESLDGIVSPKSDIYAVGVMLFQALSHGALPAVGMKLPEETPESLQRLCAAMLMKDPDKRPDARTALSMLEQAGSDFATGQQAQRAVSEPLQRVSREAADAFVGRRAVLAQLDEALRRAGERPQYFLIEGHSGIGKSALVRQVTSRLPATGLSLHSRCRFGESVPFRGLDAAFDVLADALRRMPLQLASAIAPPSTGALLRVFPAFARVDALSARKRQGLLPQDPVQVRMQAYRQLRDLLARVAAVNPLVLIVDDVQWIDGESENLLSYLLHGSDAPALMLIAAARIGHGTPPVSERLLASLGKVERISLDALSEQDAKLLARTLLDERGTGEHAALVDSIVAKSMGHPLFIRLLTDHLGAQGDGASLSLEAALHSRVSELPGPVYDALCLVALCRGSLPKPAAAHLVDQGPTDIWWELERSHLVRELPTADGGAYETYHDRVREVVLSGMSPDATRRGHGRLADVLSTLGQCETRVVIEHLAAAGRDLAAAALAQREAAAAEATMDFVRAAALYGMALGSMPEASDEWHDLQLRRARAFMRSGYFVAAAGAFSELSRASKEGALEYQAEAGLLLVSAGNMEEGFRAIVPLLKHHGLPTPETMEEIFTVGFGAFQRLVERGLSPSASPAASETALARLDLCTRLAGALALLDARGVVFAIEAFLLALELGDEARLQEVSAIFVRVTAGLFHNPLVEPALSLCRSLTHKLGTPQARLSLYLAEGEAAHFVGRFLDAALAYEGAERIALESAVDAHHELASARNGYALIEYSQKGDFRSQVERTLGWQSDAAARKDSFHETFLQVAHAIVWIAWDDPEKAQAELEAAGERWPRDASTFEVGRLLFLDVIDRYRGVEDAHLRPLQGAEAVLNSPAAQSPFVSGYIHLHRAWGALRAMARARYSEVETEMVNAAIVALRGLGPVGWQAAADAMEANLHYLRGEREAALQKLERAEQRYVTTHMLCLSACARRRRGELSGGEFGARLVEQSDDELRRLGVRSPQRWSQAYFSLFDPATTFEMTFQSSAVINTSTPPDAIRKAPKTNGNGSGS